MARYVALLRGVNVGPHKRISMAALRALLADLGLGEVRTYLQSGNATFEYAASAPEELASRVQDAIARVTGHKVCCLVRGAKEIERLVSANPFADLATDGSKLLALMLSEAPAPDLLARFPPQALDSSRITMGERVIYQWCPDGVLAAPAVGSFVERHLLVAVTARNWNTMTALLAMLRETADGSAPAAGPPRR